MLQEKNRNESIYIKYADDLYDYGRSLGFAHETCLDAIHDVYVNYYVKLPSVSSNKLKSYLFRSVKNRLIDIYRTNSRMSFGEFDETVIDFELNIQDTIITEEEQYLLKRRIKNLLKDLTAKQREVLYLRFVQELDYSDIANIMDISSESTRKLVYRTLKVIRSNPHFCFIFTLFILSELQIIRNVKVTDLHTI